MNLVKEDFCDVDSRSGIGEITVQILKFLDSSFRGNDGMDVNSRLPAQKPVGRFIDGPGRYGILFW